MIEQWVPFQKGEYLTERAFLFTPDNSAIHIEKAVIEVYTDMREIRRIKGTGMIRPALMVELHEEYDEIDLLLDMGGKYKYVLKKPVLNAGKLFSAGVQSQLQFYPSAPWEQLSEAEFDELAGRLSTLD